MTSFVLTLLRMNLANANKQVRKYQPTKKHKKGFHYPHAAEEYYSKQLKHWIPIRDELQSTLDFLKLKLSCVYVYLDRKGETMINVMSYTGATQRRYKIVYIGSSEDCWQWQNDHQYDMALTIQPKKK